MVFARVILAQTMADQVDGAVAIAKRQLPGARGQQGYQGFYVLADRTSGKLMTISLWDSREDLLAVEARAAQVREDTAESIGTARLPVDIYQVEIADWAP
jgi:heme-degrading monooxygenase HmoA